MHKMFY